MTQILKLLRKKNSFSFVYFDQISWIDGKLGSREVRKSESLEVGVKPE